MPVRAVFPFTPIIPFLCSSHFFQVTQEELGNILAFLIPFVACIFQVSAVLIVCRVGQTHGLVLFFDWNHQHVSNFVPPRPWFGPSCPNLSFSRMRTSASARERWATRPSMVSGREQGRGRASGEGGMRWQGLGWACLAAVGPCLLLVVGKPKRRNVLLQRSRLWLPLCC